METFSHENRCFKNILYNEAKKIGIELCDQKIEQFEMYKNILIEWNKKVNLTAITDDYQIIMKHFIDCLEIVKYIDENSKVIDVGTGAGFPGIVIAIYFGSSVEVTLVDSLNKRINFLEEIKNILRLENITIIHARAEELALKEEHREKYDFVVSRAVAPLNILLEYDVPFLKVNSKCLLLKGNNASEEIKNSQNALKILNSKISNIYEYSYSVWDEEYSRKVVEIIKNKPTSNKYPRNFGKIKKKAL